MTHLHKNSYFSFIVNSRIIVRASDERAWHSLQENDAILKKYAELSKNYVLAYYFCVIGGRIMFCISGERD